MVVLPDKPDYGSFTDEPSTTSSCSSTGSSPGITLSHGTVPTGTNAGPTDGLSSTLTNETNQLRKKPRNNILRPNNYSNNQVLTDGSNQTAGLNSTGDHSKNSANGVGATGSGTLSGKNLSVLTESPTRRRLVSSGSSGIQLNSELSDRTLSAVINTSDSVIITISNHNNNNNNSSNGPNLLIEKDSTPASSPASSPMSSSSNDFHQRQPLLQEAKLSRSWDDEDSPLDDIEISKETKRSGSAIRINIPAPSGSRSEGENNSSSKRFPEERIKTLITFGWLSFNFMLATVSLALTHERLPDPVKSNALPDIILDNITAQDWALTVSEILLSASTFAAFTILIFHRHRWIVFRRVFFILGCLYLMRSLTMYVTVLPVASRSYALNVCAPKANTTSVLLIARRAIQLMSGFGLSMNGQHVYCGDYMYSGHTVVLVSAYLVIKEYSSKKCYIIHWISWIVSSVGVTMILLSRGHYTVDVLVAYWVTTRLFWMYHTMANNPVLKNKTPTNFLSRVWWFPVFRYLEGNIGGPVPRTYSCPIACFDRFWRRFKTFRRGHL